MKVNQLKLGSALSYMQMGLNILIGLIYTPIMLRMLGKGEYGLYQTVASTISMLSVLNLGFNSSYIRYYSKYKSNNDFDSIFRINGLFIIIFSVIGIISLFCGAFLSFNLEFVFDKGLTSEEYGVARVLMILLTLNLAASFPMSVFSNIISAHEKFVFLKLLGMLKTVGGPLVTIPLLLLGFRSIGMVVVTLAISFLTDIAYFFYVKRKLKQRFIFNSFEKGIFKDLFVFTAFIAIDIIAYQINGNIGKLMLGRFHGTDIVAIYSVGFVLYHYYMQFSTAISSVFTPRIHGIVISTNYDLKKQKSELTDLFTKVGRIQFLLLALIASGVFFFGKPFILKWAGDGYDDAYIVAVMLLFSSTIAFIQNLGIEIQRAENNHRFRSIIYIVMAIFNLLITLILCPKFGIVGAAIGTSASLLLANGLVMNIYYHLRCSIDIFYFWKSIGRLSIGLILPCVFGFLLNYFTDVNSTVVLIVDILVYSAVYIVSMWFFGINQSEKNILIKPLIALKCRCRK